MKALLKLVLAWGVVGLAGSAGAKEGAGVSSTFSATRIDSNIQKDADLEDYLGPFREGVVVFGREVIGQAAEDLKTRRKPENGVSNLVADAIRALGAEAFEGGVDVAISNFGGLRRDLDKGPITVGMVTELSPFENFLVLVEGKGDLVLNIARQLARRGGEPVSGMDLVYGRGGKVISVTVGGKKIDPKKTYRVVTLDYLYGTDKAIWRSDLILNTTMSGTRQRDSIIEYMKRLDAKGIRISDAGDGRISFRD